MTITLHPPVVVGRRSGYYWFPTLVRLGDGALLVSAWDDLDAYSGGPMGLYNWSEDGGNTWTDPLATRAPFSESGLPLPGGDHLLLPYRLFPAGEDDALRGAACLVPMRRREVVPHPRDVRVTGLPRPPEREGDAVITARFSFNGQTVALSGSEGERYLTTLYGHFRGDKRYTILFATSEDGWDWSVRSLLGGAQCSLPGAQGPCEAALARVKDGRLMCVFRTDGNIDDVYDPDSGTSAAPYGVVFSADDGATWTAPEQLSLPVRHGSAAEFADRRPGSVQPSLAALPDGTLALSGGRPGLFLWVSRDGAGREWTEIDLRAHHNRHCPPGETIDSLINTSSYTEVVAVPGGEGAGRASVTLLVVYDRLPLGWRPISDAASGQCVVWLTRVTLDPARA